MGVKVIYSGPNSVADPEIKKRGVAPERGDPPKLKTILEFITLTDPERGGSESFLPFVWKKCQNRVKRILIG